MDLGERLLVGKRRRRFEPSEGVGEQFQRERGAVHHRANGRYSATRDSQRRHAPRALERAPPFLGLWGRAASTVRWNRIEDNSGRSRLRSSNGRARRRSRSSDGTSDSKARLAARRLEQPHGEVRARSVLFTGHSRKRGARTRVRIDPSPGLASTRRIQPLGGALRCGARQPAEVLHLATTRLVRKRVRSTRLWQGVSCVFSQSFGVGLQAEVPRALGHEDKRRRRAAWFEARAQYQSIVP